MRRLYIPVMVFILLLPLAGRLVFHRLDATFFIVADERFTDPDLLPFPVTVVEGPGYDGQFFFKTALDLSMPFEKGMSYDDADYRKQRIVYPLLAWLAALGIPRLIPFSMIAINCLALVLIWKIFYDICQEESIPVLYSLLPVLFVGLQMSAARDLADPLMTLFVICLLRFGISNPLAFIVFASLALFTKETSLLFTFPVAVLMIPALWKKKSKPRAYVMLLLPFSMLPAWELFLDASSKSVSYVHGMYNLTFPFSGIITGFLSYFEGITLKSMAEFVLALLALIWLIWLGILSAPYIKAAVLDKFKNRYAEVGWLAWFIFSMFFSSAIYGDDWSFVRLFSAFAAVSFFILYSHRTQPGKWFVLFSIFLFAITTIRLWLRV